eukprot:CAMPEP_0184655008 /NCGR_PEP_ID=MMETSP0308-20130426/12652_1 /TAXON_ID=38269 /ORGANISM="Gloeochaete witrockiana, Strain SAG 46.84" /LENGTH=643 /DNA_ID=CAMNT_0027091249 /DNA_START=34 /DNA_END=1965 /DNA_ORIENTATION=+
MTPRKKQRRTQIHVPYQHAIANDSNSHVHDKGNNRNELSEILEGTLEKENEVDSSSRKIRDEIDHAEDVSLEIAQTSEEIEGEGTEDVVSATASASGIEIPGEMGLQHFVKKANEAEIKVPRKRRNRREEGMRERSAAVPAWMKAARVISDTDEPVAVEDVTQELGLDERIGECLRAQGIKQLFAMQVQVLRTVIQFGRERDVCVSAPTGSGKTLAYVLPIVQTLSKRVVRRLRALVVVPTRDLALQVTSVFKPFCNALNLTVHTAIGSVSFAEEQSRLCPGIGRGAGAADVVVATPGRLMDHLRDTPAFTLQHLSFLVIDEADRLLMQSYQEWLQTVLQSIAAALQSQSHHQPQQLTYSISADGGLDLHCSAPRLNAAMCGVLPSTASSPHRCHVRKLLFSATLSRNPAKIAALGLTAPYYFAASSNSRYKTPAALMEYMIVCDGGQKPIIFIHLLNAMNFNSTLCFTRSVESAHRLAVLLQLWGIQEVGEYSSLLSQTKRSAILADFRTGKIKVLVCSDAMARGMDVALVEAVVNYDVPTRIKTYIHRAGRTARAGRPGATFTLMRDDQVAYFKDMLQKAEHGQVKNYKIDEATVQAMLPKYLECLSHLKESVLHNKNADGNLPTDKQKHAAHTNTPAKAK